MSDKINHSGVVETVDGEHLRVRILQTSACSACKVAGHCSAAESKEKIKQIISDDETLKKAAVEILANLFKDRFMTAFTQDYRFLEALSNRVACILTEKSQII